MNERTCENCRWWKLVDEDTGIGRCYRHAPMPINMFGEDEANGEEAQAYWPGCCDTHFCGEWADKTITPEQEQKRELVRRFAVAMIASGSDELMHKIWRVAEVMADAEPRLVAKSDS